MRRNSFQWRIINYQYNWGIRGVFAMQSVWGHIRLRNVFNEWEYACHWNEYTMQWLPWVGQLSNHK